jgi:hypothetical protein
MNSMNNYFLGDYGKFFKKKNVVKKEKEEHQEK